MANLRRLAVIAIITYVILLGVILFVIFFRGSVSPTLGDQFKNFGFEVPVGFLVSHDKVDNKDFLTLQSTVTANPGALAIYDVDDFPSSTPQFQFSVANLASSWMPFKLSTTTSIYIGNKHYNILYFYPEDKLSSKLNLDKIIQSFKKY